MPAPTLWNVPNILTLMRVALIPVLVLLAYWPVSFAWQNLLVAGIFLFAAITDWFDGYLARAWNQTSAFGRFLDPVADKLMVATALVVTVQHHHTAWMALWASVIIGREIAVSALREWMAEIGQHAKVSVAMVGKIKTTVQMIALGFLLYRDPLWGLPIFLIGEWLLAAAAVLTLWSGFEYLRAAWPALVDDSPKRVDSSR